MRDLWSYQVPLLVSVVLPCPIGNLPLLSYCPLQFPSLVVLPYQTAQCHCCILSYCLDEFYTPLPSLTVHTYRVTKFDCPYIQSYQVSLSMHTELPSFTVHTYRVTKFDCPYRQSYQVSLSIHTELPSLTVHTYRVTKFHCPYIQSYQV